MRRSITGIAVYVMAALLLALTTGTAKASTVLIGIQSSDLDGVIDVPVGDPVARFSVFWNGFNPYPEVPFGFYPPLPAASVSIDWGDGTTTSFAPGVLTSTVWLSHPFSDVGFKWITATYTKYWHNAADPYGAPLMEVVSNTNGLNVAQTPLPAALPLFTAALGVLGFCGWTRRRTA